MSATFSITGDAGGAVKAVDALSKALDEVGKNANNAVAPTKKLQESATRLAQQADPQERYNAKMKALAEAVKGGGLAIDKANTLAERYRATLERAGKAGDDAFGASAVASVGRIGSEILGISSALGLAIDAMRQYREEQKKASDDAVRARQGIGQLSQLAASDKNPQQAYLKLVAEADRYLQMGAAGDRGEAAMLTFDLAAAGLEEKDRAFAAKMRSTGTLTNVGGLAQSYDALRTAMGAGEVGSFEEFAAKALAAGATAPGTVEQLPVALARAGSNAKKLGISDEFLLAAGATLAKEAGSPSEGGTKLAALLGGMQKSGIDLTGLTGAQMIERLSQENTEYGGIFKDNAEAVSAFRTLKGNLGSVQSLESDIFAAQNLGLAQTAVGLPNLDDSQRAANFLVESTGKEAWYNDKTLSRGESLRQAALKDWIVKRRQEAPGIGTEWDIAMERAATNVPILGNADTHLQMVATAAPGGPGSIENQALLAEIRDYLKDIQETNRNVDRTTKSKVTTRQE